MAECGPGDDLFMKYAPLIAAERGQAEPLTEEEHAALFASLADMEHCKKKGPLVKLMRWFSFFESAEFYKNDFLCHQDVVGVPQWKGCP